MGRPKGSTNKPKDTTPTTVTLTTALADPVNEVEADADADAEETGGGDDKEDLSKIKLCESRGIFGIISQPKRNYVTVVQRHYFAEETHTTSPRGGPKVQLAGSYGPWQLTKAVYPTGIPAALMWVATRLEQEYLAHDEARDLRNLAAISQKAKDEVLAYAKANSIIR